MGEYFYRSPAQVPALDNRSASWLSSLGMCCNRKYLNCPTSAFTLDRYLCTNLLVLHTLHLPDLLEADQRIRSGTLLLLVRILGQLLMFRIRFGCLLLGSQSSLHVGGWSLRDFLGQLRPRFLCHWMPHRRTGSILILDFPLEYLLLGVEGKSARKSASTWDLIAILGCRWDRTHWVLPPILSNRPECSGLASMEFSGWFVILHRICLEVGSQFLVAIIKVSVSFFIIRYLNLAPRSVLLT